MPKRHVNGVPIDDCLQLVEHVRSNPDEGKTLWSSVTNWKGGFKCESRIREHEVRMDEPELLGGTDTAPNMVEQVLAAYGSCLTVGYSLNAAVRGIELRELRVEVEGDLDLAGFFGLSEEVAPGFSNIRTKVYLDSDADEEALEALHAHVLQTSPVGSILASPINVETKLVRKSRAVEIA